jgi:hypothetical protein
VDAKATAVKYMAVNHRCRDMLVPEKFLDGPNIVTPFEQIRRERVPQAVRCRRFGNTAPPDGALENALKCGLMQMAPTLHSSFSLEVSSGCRKHPLPCPFPVREFLPSVSANRAPTGA